MNTLPARSVTASELDQLDDVLLRLSQTESPLGEMLLRATAALRSGATVAFAELDEVLSPADAATLLAMSRTHFYKLLDSGTVPSFRVGRDRRVRLADVVAFNETRMDDKAGLAQRFSRFDASHDSLLDAIVKRGDRG